jgi:hypothetical protein
LISLLSLKEIHVNELKKQDFFRKPLTNPTVL